MKKTLFLVAALCAAVAQAETTYTYNGSGWDATPGITTEKYVNSSDMKEISYQAYKLTDDSIFDVKAGTAQLIGATIAGSGNLTKTGEGTLVTRVNDNASGNVFGGNVTVNAGKLEITSTGSVTIGVGEEAKITVAKGATLQFDDSTGINIPAANESYSGPNTIALRNDKKTSNVYGVSQLSNVIVTTNAIVANDESVRGSVTVNEANIADSTHAADNVIKGVDLYANQFAVSGNAVMDNAKVHVSTNVVQNLFGEVSMDLRNGSKLIFDDETYQANYKPGQEEHSAYIRNTKVDKTSYINAGNKEGELLKDERGNLLDMTYVQLMQGNELHIASSGKEGGVADHSFRDSDGNIAKTIDELGKVEVVEDVYVTDQLSGCALMQGSMLMVTLDDTMLPDPMAYREFTFTVVLKGLDSTAVLGDYTPGEFYDMDENSPVQLSIGAYKDAPWYQMDTKIQLAAFSSYVEGEGEDAKKQGPATVFKFTVTKLVVPEPATATLSLLALAGLAARRRRH